MIMMYGVIFFLIGVAISTPLKMTLYKIVKFVFVLIEYLRERGHDRKAHLTKREEGQS